MSDVLSSWLGLSPDVSIRWGLTLLHFLWQGALIGLLAFAAAKLLRNHSAVLRYWLHAIALLACPVSVAGTFAMVEVPQASQKSSLSLSSTTAMANGPSSLRDMPYPQLKAGDSSASSGNATAISATSPTSTVAGLPDLSTPVVGSEFTFTWLPVMASWMTMLYAAGVFCFLIRLAIALWGGHRLRAISKPVSDSALLALIRSQAERIGLKFVPVVAYCERIAVPTVIGVLRPMILLPATLTTGLTTDELSAILSHELAHIRRYDLWMNLLQRIIESLLFFHPVVWFLSRRLRAEREICCDDLVIRSGHQPMNYAGALLRMAELCTGVSPQTSLSLAATSGGTTLLEHRVLRLIHKSPSTRLSLDRKGLMLFVGSTVALTTVLSAILAFTLSPTTEPSALYGTGGQESASPSKSTNADSVMASVQIEGNSVVTASTIKTMIQIKDGETISDEWIRNSCRALMKSRLFFSVKTRVDATPTGAVLVFIVHERPQVQKVEFHGNRWLSKEELERVTGMKTGALFDHVWNRETANRIRFEYGQRGYQFAEVRLTKGGDKDDREVVFEINEGPRADVCFVDVDNLVPRSLADAISNLNRDSKESTSGVSQPPVTEQETRETIAKFAAEKHVPDGVRTQLEQILKSGELPSNVYFRRFTRFDDGKQMQEVWWVRLVVETENGPVYSVPVRSTSLSARPYTQMERQQNASENITLLSRVSSYVDQAKFRNIPSDVFISMNIPKVRDSEIERFLEQTEAALRNGDLNALLAFHDWRETSDSTREFVTAELNRLLSGTVHDVWYSPREGHKVTTWSAWQFYKPNLPVAGFLKISYSPDAGKENSSPDDHQILALELGVDEGELRIVNYIKDGKANPPQELNPGPSITGHLEPLADGTHLVTDIITNLGWLLSAHLANEEIRLRDFPK